jgi:hypothetical protein
LFRFRIYAAPRQLEHWLAELRERNIELEVRAETLAVETPERRERARPRSLELSPETVPAAPSASP